MAVRRRRSGRAQENDSRAAREGDPDPAALRALRGRRLCCSLRLPHAPTPPLRFAVVLPVPFAAAAPRAPRRRCSSRPPCAPLLLAAAPPLLPLPFAAAAPQAPRRRCSSRPRRRSYRCPVRPTPPLFVAAAPHAAAAAGKSNREEEIGVREGGQRRRSGKKGTGGDRAENGKWEESRACCAVVGCRARIFKCAAR